MLRATTVSNVVLSNWNCGKNMNLKKVWVRLRNEREYQLGWMSRAKAISNSLFYETWIEDNSQGLKHKDQDCLMNAREQATTF